jgi:hypothetical protein
MTMAHDTRANCQLLIASCFFVALLPVKILGSVVYLVDLIYLEC